MMGKAVAAMAAVHKPVTYTVLGENRTHAPRTTARNATALTVRHTVCRGVAFWPVIGVLQTVLLRSSENGSPDQRAMTGRRSHVHASPVPLRAAGETEPRATPRVQRRCTPTLVASRSSVLPFPITDGLDAVDEGRDRLLSRRQILDLGSQLFHGVPTCLPCLEPHPRLTGGDNPALEKG